MTDPNALKPCVASHSRRAFLAATGVSAFATFHVVPRHVLGGPGYTPPSETVNLAGIGAGGMGGGDIATHARNGANVVALCDVDDDRAAGTFRNFPKARKYKDFRKLIDQEAKHIDAVTVGTPDHIHAVWSLPENDANFSVRWSMIKGGFSRGVPANADRTTSKTARREKGIWQRRYWEHAIRDETDMARHIDYIHFNPVKHGLVPRAGDWPHGPFARYVERALLPADWGGDMREITGQFGE